MLAFLSIFDVKVRIFLGELAFVGVNALSLVVENIRAFLDTIFNGPADVDKFALVAGGNADISRHSSNGDSSNVVRGAEGNAVVERFVFVDREIFICSAAPILADDYREFS